MAKDGLNIDVSDLKKMDKALSNLAITSQSKASRIVDSSLTKAAADTRKKVKKAAPKSTGQLRRSIKSGLRKKVNVPRDVFLAGVWFQQGKSLGNADGYYARWVLKTHKANASGHTGGDDFLTPALKASRAGFISVIDKQLSRKIVEGFRIPKEMPKEGVL